MLPPNSPLTLTDVECNVCLGVLVRPLQLSCGGICCTSCLCSWVKYAPTLDPLCCPCCIVPHEIQENTVLSAPPVLLKLLDGLIVCCRRCQERVAADQHLEHLESGCKQYIKTNPSTGSLPQDVLTIPTGGRVRLSTS